MPKSVNIQVKASLDKNELNTIRKSIKKSLTNIDANINLNLGKGAQKSLDALNRKVETLKNNLEQITRTSNAAQGSLGRLAPNLNAASSAFNKFNSSTTQASRSSKSFDDSIKTNVKNLEGFAYQITISAQRFAGFAVAARTFVSLTRAIDDGIKSAIDYQKELVRLKQVGGDTGTTISGISSDIRKLSTNLGVSSSDLAKTAVVLRQAGLSIDKIKKSLDALAKTTLAPNFESLEKTTEGLIAINAQFSSSIDANIKSLGQINKVAAAYAVEAGDLIVGIQKAGSAFKAAGGSLEEYLGILTAVRSTTRESADTIATGLRTIIARTSRLKAADELRQLGIDIKATSDDAKQFGVSIGSILPIYERFRKISEGLQGVNELDPKFARTIEVVGGIRQFNKVIPLIKQFQKAEEARQLAVRSGASLDADAATAQESLAVQLSKVTEKLNRLFETFGKNSAVKTFVETIVKSTGAVLDLANALEKLAPVLLAVGLASTAKVGLNIAKFSQRGIPVRIASASPGGGSGFSFNDGGLVPGPQHVNRDIVPAMLAPGEFILRKEAVRAIGLSNVQKFNRGGIPKRKKLSYNPYDPQGALGALLNRGRFPRTKFIFDENVDYSPQKTVFQSFKQDAITNKFLFQGYDPKIKFSPAIQNPASIARRFGPMPLPPRNRKVKAIDESLRQTPGQIEEILFPQKKLGSILNPGRFPRTKFLFDSNVSYGEPPILQSQEPKITGPLPLPSPNRKVLPEKYVDKFKPNPIKSQRFRRRAQDIYIPIYEDTSNLPLPPRLSKLPKPRPESPPIPNLLPGLSFKDYDNPLGTKINRRSPRSFIGRRMLSGYRNKYFYPSKEPGYNILDLVKPLILPAVGSGAGYGLMLNNMLERGLARDPYELAASASIGFASGAATNILLGNNPLTQGLTDIVKRVGGALKRTPRHVYNFLTKPPVYNTGKYVRTNVNGVREYDPFYRRPYIRSKRQPFPDKPSVPIGKRIGSLLGRTASLTGEIIGAPVTLPVRTVEKLLDKLSNTGIGDIYKTVKQDIKSGDIFKANPYKKMGAGYDLFGNKIQDNRIAGKRFKGRSGRKYRIPRKFAGGGMVPALLTPGEMRISAPTARRIGYGTLNALNQTGSATFNHGKAAELLHRIKGTSDPRQRYAMKRVYVGLGGNPALIKGYARGGRATLLKAYKQAQSNGVGEFDPSLFSTLAGFEGINPKKFVNQAFLVKPYMRHEHPNRLIGEGFASGFYNPNTSNIHISSNLPINKYHWTPPPKDSHFFRTVAAHEFTHAIDFGLASRSIGKGALSQLNSKPAKLDDLLNHLIDNNIRSFTHPYGANPEELIANLGDLYHRYRSGSLKPTKTQLHAFSSFEDIYLKSARKFSKGGRAYKSSSKSFDKINNLFSSIGMSGIQTQSAVSRYGFVGGSPKNTLGTFDPYTKSILSHPYLPTVIHETAHAFDSKAYNGEYIGGYGSQGSNSIFTDFAIQALGIDKINQPLSRAYLNKFSDPLQALAPEAFAHGLQIVSANKLRDKIGENQYNAFSLGIDPTSKEYKALEKSAYKNVYPELLRLSRSPLSPLNRGERSALAQRLGGLRKGFISGFSKGGRVGFAKGGPNPDSLRAILANEGVKLTDKELRNIIDLYGKAQSGLSFALPQTSRGAINRQTALNQQTIDQVLEVIRFNKILSGQALPKSVDELFALFPQAAPKSLSPKFLSGIGVTPPIGSSGKPLTGAPLTSTFNKLLTKGPVGKRGALIGLGQGLQATQNFANTIGSQDLTTIIRAFSPSKKNPGILSGSAIPTSALDFNKPEFRSLGIKNIEDLSRFGEFKGVFGKGQKAPKNLGATNLFDQIPLLRAVNKAFFKVINAGGRYNPVVKSGSDNSYIGSNADLISGKQSLQDIPIENLSPGLLNNIGQILYRDAQNSGRIPVGASKQIIPGKPGRYTFNPGDVRFNRGRFNPRKEYINSFDLAGQELQNRVSSGATVTPRQARIETTNRASQIYEDRFIGSFGVSPSERSALRTVFRTTLKTYKKEADEIEKGFRARGDLEKAEKFAAKKIEYAYTRATKATRAQVGNLPEILASTGPGGFRDPQFKYNRKPIIFGGRDNPNRRIFGGLSGRAISRKLQGFGQTRLGRLAGNPILPLALGTAASFLPSGDPTSADRPKNRLLAGLSGAAIGGATGASLGLFGGPSAPILAAVGALSGAVIGATTSLLAFEKQVKEFKFDQELGALLKRATASINTTGTVNTNARVYIADALEKAKNEAARRSPTNVSDQSRFIAEQLNQFPVEQIIRKILTDNPKIRTLSDFQNFKGKSGSKLIEAYAGANQFSIAESEKFVSNIIQQSATINKTNDAMDKFQKAVADSELLFQELNRSIELSSEKLIRDFGSLDKFTTLIGGKVNPSIAFNGGFTQNAQIFSSAFGTQGGRIGGLATEYDKAIKALPNIIRGIAGKGDLEQAFTQEIDKLLGSNSEVARRFNDAFQAIAEDIQNNGTKNIEKNISELAKEAFPGLAEAISNGTDLLKDALSKLVSRLDDVRQLELANRGNYFSFVSAGAERLRNRSQAFGLNPSRSLSLSQLNSVNIAQQRALTGFNDANAFNPQAIGQSLQTTLEDIKKQTDILQNPNTTDFNTIVETTKKLSALQYRAEDLQAALKNLTDTTQQSTAIQERLNAVSQEKDARLSFAEQYLRSDYAGRAAIQRTARQTQIATFTGLDAFSPQAINDILNFLRAASNVTFQNGLTGEQISKNLVGNSQAGRFLQAPQFNQAEQNLRGLQDFVLKNAQDAAKQLGSALATDQERLTGDLKIIFKDFLDGLDSVLVNALSNDQKRKALNQQESINKNKELAGSAVLTGINSSTFGALAKLAGSGALDELKVKRDEANKLSSAFNYIQSNINKFGLDKNVKTRYISGRFGAAAGPGYAPTFAENLDKKAFITKQYKDLFSQAGLSNEQTQSFLDTIFKGNYSDANFRQKSLNEFFGNQFGNVDYLGSVRKASLDSGVSVNDLTKALEVTIDPTISAKLDQIVEALNQNVITLKDIATNEPLGKFRVAQSALLGSIPFASGGLVPGIGNRDKIPARLTPGEFVVPKLAASKNITALTYMQRGGVLRQPPLHSIPEPYIFRSNIRRRNPLSQRAIHQPSVNIRNFQKEAEILQNQTDALNKIKQDLLASLNNDTKQPIKKKNQTSKPVLRQPPPNKPKPIDPSLIRPSKSPRIYSGNDLINAATIPAPFVGPQNATLDYNYELQKTIRHRRQRQRRNRFNYNYYPRLYPQTFSDFYGPRINARQYFHNAAGYYGNTGAYFGYYGFANGGMAPRGTDTVPAMLTPGEFIVNARAAKKFLPQLQHINTQYKADGGSIGSSNVDFSAFGKDLIKPLNDFNATGTLLVKTFSELNTKMGELAASLSNLKMTVEGKQTHEVIINGASVLQQIMPQIKEMIIDGAANAIQQEFEKQRFTANPV